MIDNPYSAFWKAIRGEKKATVFYLAVMTGSNSVKLGTLPLTDDDLMINAAWKGKLKSGDTVLLTPLDADGQRFIILCKVVKP